MESVLNPNAPEFTPGAPLGASKNREGCSATRETGNSSRKEQEKEKVKERSEKKGKAEPAEPKTWEEQIAKREYQIKLRKETSEYKAYISHRPRSKRRDDEPQTPRCDCREDNGKKVSKRHW